MKNLAPILTVCCGSNGDLSFIVETDAAMVVSRYYNLLLDAANSAAAVTAKDSLEEISCQVDTRQISLCFASIQVRKAHLSQIFRFLFSEISFLFNFILVSKHPNEWKYDTR